MSRLASTCCSQVSRTVLISDLTRPFSFISLINLLHFASTFCHTRLHLCLLVVFLCSCSLSFQLAIHPSIHPSILASFDPSILSSILLLCSLLSSPFPSCHSSLDSLEAFLSFFLSLSFLACQSTNFSIISSKIYDWEQSGWTREAEEA